MGFDLSDKKYQGLKDQIEMRDDILEVYFNPAGDWTLQPCKGYDIEVSAAEVLKPSINTGKAIAAAVAAAPAAAKKTAAPAAPAEGAAETDTPAGEVEL